MSGTLRILCQFRFGTNLALRNGKLVSPAAALTTPSLSSRVANLVTVAKQTEEDGFIKIAPFPYKTKRYTKLHVSFPFLDPTEVRMNKNSKVIVVEGNIGSKKDEFAKGIAEAFGMHYMPEPRIDDLYINHDGFDYRTLNQYIHPKLWALDEKMFYENPHHPAVPWMKIFFYQQRFIQYFDALAHLFNTGQGVVLERSAHSDFVFADAMVKCGFLPKDAYDYYYRLRYDTLHHLKRPHLVIYLDTDVDILMKRIKERGIPHQVNSKVLTKEYLSEIENSYKRKYLEDADKYSELLILKWNQPQPLNDAIIEIEKLNLDDWDMKGDKFRDWNFYLHSQIHEARHFYTNNRLEYCIEFMDTLIYDVDSLECYAGDYEHRNHIYECMVPNYGKIPKVTSKKSLISSLFTFPTRREQEDFNLRCPFY